MAGRNIASAVEELVRPTVEGFGYVLWDVEYVKIGAEWHLIITIDKEGGINIEDCERVHRAIDPILDEEDPIEQAYRLEVSSPGIERDLKKDMHFLSVLGQRVEVRLFAPVMGVKTLRGVLLGYDGGLLTVGVDGAEPITLEKGTYSKVQTLFFE